MNTRTARTGKAGKASKLLATLWGVTSLLSSVVYTALDDTVLDPRIRRAGAAGLGR